jgi:hypothetical protein
MPTTPLRAPNPHLAPTQASHPRLPTSDVSRPIEGCPTLSGSLFEIHVEQRY